MPAYKAVYPDGRVPEGGIIACLADAPPGKWYVAVHASFLDGLTPLFTYDGVTYFGHPKPPSTRDAKE